ncbi:MULTISPECIES: SGNH/GDSL hydrolase family protein [unclassified Sphingomonas]|uniref:SGNH/GDSL hydrolase family protein n=1 Tax=unclassified Sphingomonas TaxID=196159 RepID=UPI0006FFB1DF|nr:MULTISPECIES: SGNH/GDSL hydrolase family protein [unclassified Sphingomonas]KQM60048.1 hypothetical protein ASE65_10100 [Sphingomonas sp. Leaf16]KQN11446.1 hypothetical protein ASE81_11085 [Sphingomonas sp. Leaf29]KQN18768.1 hypothetical protein ASE83_11025 [Sphingomonas sp. Leaf32]
MEVMFPGSAAVFSRPRDVISATGDSRIDGIYVDPFKLTYGARSPLVVAKALLGQRFVVGLTYGVSGERTDQILKRMLDGTGDPRKTNAGIMYLQCGVNDVAQTSSTGPAIFVDAVSGATITIANVAENAAKNIRTMVQLALDAAMIVVVENEVGANGINSVEKTAALMDLRQMLTEYGEVTPNVYVHDAFAIITNPTASATGIVLRPTLVYDVTHPNALGGYLWGKSLSALFDRLITPARGSIMIQNVAEAAGNGRRQLLANPLFATASGGNAGTGVSTAILTANTTSGSSSLVVTAGRAVPSGTQVTGSGIPANTFVNTTGTAGTYSMVNAAGSAVAATATATGVSVSATIVPGGYIASAGGGATAIIDNVPSANGLGNDVTIVATFAGNGDLVRLRQDLNGSSANGGTYNAALRAGDIIQAVAMVDITAPPVNLSSLYLSLVSNSGGGGGATSVSSFDMFAANASVDYGINEPCSLMLSTRPFALPTITGTFPYVTAEVRAVARAAGSCNFTIRQMGVRRRSTLY